MLLVRLIRIKKVVNMSGAVAWRFTRTGASTLNDIPRLRAQFVDSRSYKQVSCGVVAFVNNPYDTGVSFSKIS